MDTSAPPFQVRIEARLDAWNFLYREQLALNELRRILPECWIRKAHSQMSMDKAHAKTSWHSGIPCVSLAALGFWTRKSAPPCFGGRRERMTRNDCAQAIDVIDTSIKKIPRFC
jgi:hypothetical protein